MTFKAMVTIAALFGALAVQAAALDQAPLMANIPFAFQVGDQQMPAGKYTVASAAPGVLWIRDTEHRATTNVQVVLKQPKMAQAKPVLVFNKYGERYFLREVWREGMANDAQIRQSKSERELMQAAAPERVNVWVVAYNK
jgi:hypothetical protein